MNDKFLIRFRFERRSDLVRLVAMSLLAAIMLISLAWQAFAAPGTEAPESISPKAYWPRRYYLTPTYYNGGDADGSDGNGAGVCAPGFHFASQWEIQDTSNLKYETSLGITQTDSASGPPSWHSGWVRTAYNSDSGTVPGHANCNIWTSPNPNDYGTIIYLPRYWTGGLERIPWLASISQCNGTVPVWCVADQAGYQVYLPLVIE
ncbi:hypothetical protein ACFLZW_04705 [Chloroflexota bacterium]